MSDTRASETGVLVSRCGEMSRNGPGSEKADGVGETPGTQVPAGIGSAHSRVWATTLNDSMKNPKNPDTAKVEGSAASLLQASGVHSQVSLSQVALGAALEAEGP